MGVNEKKVSIMPISIEDLVEKGLTTPNRVKRAEEIKIQLKETFGTLFYAESVDEKGKTHNCMLDIETAKRNCDCTDFIIRKGTILCAHLIALLKTITAEEVKKMEEERGEGEPSGPADFLTTGCESIDLILGGGIPRRVITLAYSKYNVGKSILGMQLASSIHYVTGLPSLYIDTEDQWTLERDRVRVLEFFQRRWNKPELPDVQFLFMPDIYDLMKLFGKVLRLEVSKKAKKITAKVWPVKEPKESPIYILCQQHKYGILILDSISGPLKDEIPTPPSENFPARAVVLNSILGRFRRCIVDLNIPGYVTAHASGAPAPFGGRAKGMDKPYGPAPLGFHIKRIVMIKGNPRKEDRTFYRFRGPGLQPIERQIKLKFDVGYVDYGEEEEREEEES